MVVTKSLCGFVSNQIQYYIESAQYNMEGAQYVNCLIIVVLQKNSMQPRGRSLNSMN